jgi:hypothetical protein
LRAEAGKLTEFGAEIGGEILTESLTEFIEPLNNSEFRANSFS